MNDGGVVLVTGVGQGFGRAIALGWGRAGYDVVCADRDVALASKTAAEVEEVGGQAIPVQLDVTVPLDVRQAFAKVDELFGRLDGVVHVASRGGDGDATTLADGAFGELVDEVLRSSHLVLRNAGRRMEDGFVLVVGPDAASDEPHDAMTRAGLAALVRGYVPRLAHLRLGLVTPSRPASDPHHDAPLVDAALFLGGPGGVGLPGATLDVTLPPPPRRVERLLPEVQAALGHPSEADDEADADATDDGPDAPWDDEDAPSADAAWDAPDGPAWVAADGVR
ncbi:MAG: SDR family oxidoreductase, partial [Trueperaceae bacterium]|nr:SDR family oxidoreductase [Trueperaceae bacterium]